MTSAASEEVLAEYIAPEERLYGLSAEQISSITGAHITTARRWRRECGEIPEPARRLLAITVGGDAKLLREIWPSCPCGATEQWQTVEDYPEYEVSNHGRVRKVARGLWKLLKTPRTPRGYCVVGLGTYTKTLHILVLETFVSARPDGKCGCHYDGDQQNNHVTNLRWDTPKGNFEDRDRHGTTSRGEKVWSHILTEADIPRVVELARSGSTRLQIAKEFDVDPTTITRVLLGDSWKHVERPE